MSVDNFVAQYGQTRQVAIFVAADVALYRRFSSVNKMYESADNRPMWTYLKKTIEADVRRTVPDCLLTLPLPLYAP